jgi:hypothetical protein
MFRAIGGIVVYGFALYGVAALVSRLKMKKVVKFEPAAASGGSGEHTNELNRQPEEIQTGIAAGA